MVNGDPGAESVFLWTKDKKGVDRRGAGSTDPKVYKKGSGDGQGVHIMTGPVFVRGAEPGDILEVRILDCVPRACANPQFKGKTVRLERRGQLGLSVQRPARRNEAGGRDDLPA